MCHVVKCGPRFNSHPYTQKKINLVLRCGNIYFKCCGMLIKLAWGNLIARINVEWTPTNHLGHA